MREGTGGGRDLRPGTRSEAPGPRALLTDPGFRLLVDLVADGGVVVLSGAGLSTESGIPDYRGETGRRRRTRPMTYQTFVGSAAARRRYWARGHLGWRHIDRALPNTGHRAVAALQARGLVSGIITQNVDGLHQAAGSRRVVELHGTLALVRCLDCGEAISRSSYHERLLALNPGWLESLDGGSTELAPDGDAELPARAESSFRIAPCDHCGGVLKPDVVFFGENVPHDRIAEAWRLFEEGDALLVVGSSLTVYSGRRFIYRAEELGVPIGIVNLGPTRADDLAAVKVEGRVGEVLPRLAERWLD